MFLTPCFSNNVRPQPLGRFWTPRSPHLKMLPHISNNSISRLYFSVYLSNLETFVEAYKSLKYHIQWTCYHKSHGNRLRGWGWVLFKRKICRTILLSDAAQTHPLDRFYEFNTNKYTLDDLFVISNTVYFFISVYKVPSEMKNKLTQLTRRRAVHAWSGWLVDLLISY